MARTLALAPLALLLCLVPSFAQDRGGYDPAERLKAMDANNDGKLEAEEIPERFRSFMMRRFEDAGLDTSKPIDINAYVEAREQRGDNDRDRDRGRDGDRDRDRDRRESRDQKDESLVPGFGEAVELAAVPGFGGDLSADGGIRAGGVPLEDRYHSRIIDYVEGIMRRYDDNKDGVVDSNEWKEGRWRDPRPEESDLNNDGRLTREELCKRISKYDEFSRLESPSSSSSSSGASSYGSSGSSGSSGDDKSKFEQYARSLIERYDESKNGVLEESEWKKMSGYHHSADANNDKVITKEELMDRLAAYSNRSSRGSDSRGSSGSRSDDDEPAAPGESYRVVGESTRVRLTTDVERLPKGLPDWFTRNDANADGQISMAEFAVSWTDDKIEEFRQHDANNDGIITPAEATGRGSSKSSSYASRSSGDSSRSSSSSGPSRSFSPPSGGGSSSRGPSSSRFGGGRGGR